MYRSHDIDSRAPSDTVVHEILNTRKLPHTFGLRLTAENEILIIPSLLCYGMGIIEDHNIRNTENHFFSCVLSSSLTEQLVLSVV